MSERTEVQRMFISVCRDSGFQLESTRAAAIVSRMALISPLEVWIAFGDLATMDQVADGTHPAINNPLYASPTPKEPS